MSLAELMREERRTTILVTLAEAPGKAAYEGLLQAAIQRFHSQFPSRTEVQEELRWLRDAGLVVLQDHPAPDRVSYTATLTEKGEAAAAGRIAVPGVRRPGR